MVKWPERKLYLIVFDSAKNIRVMKTNFNILVATDYSAVAINAEKYAVKLAKAMGAELIFLHIFEQSIGFPHEFVNIEKMEDSPIEFETRRLHLHVEEVLKSLDTKLDEVGYKCIVAKGNPTAEILRIGAEEKADFMIMGTHVASAFHRTFFGSHTWDIIKGIDIPVLAIPEEISYRDIQNIVFATEYRHNELPLIRMFVSLSRMFNAELTILHVTNNIFSAEFEKEMLERFSDEVKSKIDYEKLNIKLIQHEDLIDGLNGFCLESNSNWLVMSHERSFMLIGLLDPISVTKKMSFSTHVPLFAVPGNYIPESGLQAKLVID